jgi:hypothetical protein
MSQGPGEGVRYMNRATCGLQNSDSPISDNLTPQETTEEESGTVGADGPGLSCPGSSVAAKASSDDQGSEGR